MTFTSQQLIVEELTLQNHKINMNHKNYRPLKLQTMKLWGSTVGLYN